LKYSSRMHFESGSGLIEAEVKSADMVRVQLVQPRIFEMTGVLEIGKRRVPYAFLDTGVPHVVVFTEDLEKVDVFETGRAVREHTRFQPFGTNVNFVEVRSKKEIAVRTYERGVENETLACGTGSTASAVMSVLKGHVQSPVSVLTRGGEKLRIDIQQKGDEVTKVFLEGKVQFVYKGEYFL
jgi:diaminopimelate epimerase